MHQNTFKHTQLNNDGDERSKGNGDGKSVTRNSNEKHSTLQNHAPKRTRAGH